MKEALVGPRVMKEKWTVCWARVNRGKLERRELGRIGFRPYRVWMSMLGWNRSTGGGEGYRRIGSPWKSGCGLK